MLFGAHTSTAGGLHKAFEWGTKFKCESIQIFTKSQLQWKGKEITPDAVTKWFEAWEEAGEPPVFVHDSYLINLSSPEPELRRKSIDAFVDELARAAVLGIPWVNTHPGSHKGAGEEVGLNNCAASLREVLLRTEDIGVGILLETTAGQGDHLGAKFEHLGRLIQECRKDERMGVCVDTCHIFSAGYDLRTPEVYAATWKEFEEKVGLKYLRAFHMNDSKFDCGQKKDRHAAIGKGFIGLSGFKMLATDPRFKDFPATTELPDEDTPSSIATLKRLRDE